MGQGVFKRDKTLSKIPQFSHFLIEEAVKLKLSLKGSIKSCLFLIKYKAILCADLLPIPGNLAIKLISFCNSSCGKSKR